MRPYRNLSGKAGVRAYELGSDYILVQFQGGRTYRYSHAHAGRHHVERLKTLATAGRGLTSYISKHVHDRHDREWNPGPDLRHPTPRS